MELTEEQLEIISDNANLRVIAGAGSGKTTTLVAKAATLFPEKVLILCFNRISKEDLDRKVSEFMLSNVTVEKIHGLAIRSVFGHKKPQIENEITLPTIIQAFKIKDLSGEPNSCFILAGHIKWLLTYYYNSNFDAITDLDPEVLFRQKSDDIFSNNFDYIRDCAIALHELIKEGDVPMFHDAYLKLYALKKEVLGYKHVFFDEGQDASPVMLGIFERQKGQRVIVGDVNQQIYAWRYATDSLESVNFKEYDLTKSFRFGDQIANVVNKVLDLKFDVGLSSRRWTLQGVNRDTTIKESNLCAVVARTNMALFRQAIEWLDSREPIMNSVHFEGSFSQYLRSDTGVNLYDVYNLYSNKRHLARDTVIQSMASFKEYKHYVNLIQDHSQSLLIDLVEKYKERVLPLIDELKAINIPVEERERAEVIFTTAHKAKGMEYDEVLLLQDFITERDLRQSVAKTDANIGELTEAINLIYVSITRSKGIAFLPYGILSDLNDFKG